MLLTEANIPFTRLEQANHRWCQQTYRFFTNHYLSTSCHDSRPFLQHQSIYRAVPIRTAPPSRSMPKGPHGVHTSICAGRRKARETDY